ncbi:MAG: 16S rRNA (cytosine(967)-C(5))-methyltransferase RsmB [Solobacterium sp.]|nr:16S rRNA (cytosine(967)-C(5))-methyltransferase RsmB [Solobacterium sp.]
MENTRKQILDLLVRVFRDDGYASLLLRGADICEKDMPFASEVLYGTIRNYSLLEAQWRPLAKKTALRTALLLDMSVYQLLLMDSIPAYAVVNEAVEIAGKGQGKFVNAILRRVSEQGLKKQNGDSLEAVAFNTSHPLWILQMWKAHYGEETAVRIAYADQERARVYGRLNTLKAKKEDLGEDWYEWLGDTSFVYHGRAGIDPHLKNGETLLQDLHSQQVVSFLQAKKGMRVLDACAAPGTKSQQIACAMENEGEIVACELHEHRTGLINRLMERCGVRICRAVCTDSSKPDQFEGESFDRILIDAPCSGLGDLSHKPEIRWHLQPQDIDDIVALQEAILEANAPYLKKGGLLVYSTCTLNRKENSGRIQAFLKKHPEFELRQEKTMFPFEDRADGFYAAALLKRN